MIFDAFLVVDEWDMLELRLRTLDQIVDVFVAVRCDRTHQGEPANLPDPGSRFAPWASRMFWYVVSPHVDHPIGDRGGVGSPLYQRVERVHREKVQRACEVAGAMESDLVLVSDVDEIPTPYQILRAPDALVDLNPGRNRWLTFAQRFHSTALDLLHPQQPWFGTCASTFRALRPQEMRDARSTVGTDHQSIGVIPNGGVHFSWFGTDAERQRKLDTFSHAELRDQDPAAWRAARTHANGEPLRQLTMAEIETLDWPAPLLDGSFVPPAWWWA